MTATGLHQVQAGTGWLWAVLHRARARICHQDQPEPNAADAAAAGVNTAERQRSDPVILQAYRLPPPSRDGLLLHCNTDTPRGEFQRVLQWCSRGRIRLARPDASVQSSAKPKFLDQTIADNCFCQAPNRICTAVPCDAHSGSSRNKL